MKHTKLLYDFLKKKIVGCDAYFEHNPSAYSAIALIVYLFPTGIVDADPEHKYVAAKEYWQTLNNEYKDGSNKSLEDKIDLSIKKFQRDFDHFEIHEKLVVNWMDVVPGHPTDAKKSEIKLWSKVVPKASWLKDDTKKDVKEVQEFKTEIKKRFEDYKAFPVALSEDKDGNAWKYEDLTITDPSEPWEKERRKGMSYEALAQNSAWYSNYGLNWLFQLQFFHRFINQTVLLVTGDTGVGKSTQFPKLMRHARYVLNDKKEFKIEGIPIKSPCTVPRQAVADSNSEWIGKQLAGCRHKMKPHNRKCVDKDKRDENGKKEKWKMEDEVERYFVEFKHANEKGITQDKDSSLCTYPLTMLTDKTLLLALVKDLNSDDLPSWKPKLHSVMVDESHEHNTNMDMILTLMKKYFNKVHRLVDSKGGTVDEKKLYKLAIISATMDADEANYKAKFEPYLKECNRTCPLSARVHIQDPGATERFKRYKFYNEHRDLHEASILKSLKKAKIKCSFAGFPEFESKGIVDWCCKTYALVRKKPQYIGFGSTLIFLQSKSYIKNAVKILSQKYSSDTIVLPFFASVQKDIKDAVMNKKAGDITLDGSTMEDYADGLQVEPKTTRKRYKYKVIVSTPVAEASLTIDGLGVVIDTGIQSKPEFDPTVSLPTTIDASYIADSNSKQRIGRVGRTAPGAVFMMYSQESMKQNIPKIDITQNPFVTSMLELVTLKEYQNKNWEDVQKELRDVDGTFFVEHPDKGGGKQNFENQGKFVVPLKSTPIIDHSFRMLGGIGLYIIEDGKIRTGDIHGFYEAITKHLDIQKSDFNEQCFVLCALAHLDKRNTVVPKPCPKIEKIIAMLSYWDSNKGVFDLSAWLNSNRDGLPPRAFSKFLDKGILHMWFRMYEHVMRQVEFYCLDLVCYDSYEDYYIMWYYVKYGELYLTDPEMVKNKLKIDLKLTSEQAASKQDQKKKTQREQMNIIISKLEEKKKTLALGAPGENAQKERFKRKDTFLDYQLKSTVLKDETTFNSQNARFKRHIEMAGLSYAHWRGIPNYRNDVICNLYQGFIHKKKHLDVDSLVEQIRPLVSRATGPWFDYCLAFSHRDTLIRGSKYTIVTGTDSKQYPKCTVNQTFIKQDVKDVSTYLDSYIVNSVNNNNETTPLYRVTQVTLQNIPW